MTAPLFRWIVRHAHHSLVQSGMSTSVLRVWEEPDGWMWEVFRPGTRDSYECNRYGRDLDDARAAAIAHAQRLGVVPSDVVIEVGS